MSSMSTCNNSNLEISNFEKHGLTQRRPQKFENPKKTDVKRLDKRSIIYVGKGKMNTSRKNSPFCSPCRSFGKAIGNTEAKLMKFL